MNCLLKDLLSRYPEYADFIHEVWGDEDYFGDLGTDEEMFYNIEIDVERRIAESEAREARDD